MARIIGTSYSEDIYGTNNDDDIEGRGGDDALFGYGGHDFLLGGSGHDDLDGGTGADWMEGGSGDDLYVVDSVEDKAVEEPGEGIDVVLTYLSTYALGANVEDLVALSQADFRGTGNGLDNYIYGYDGDDILDGGAGNDSLFGEKGDDAYFIDDSGDRAIELGNEGYDTVFTSLATATLAANVEALIFDGTGAFTGIGNVSDNYIEGGAGADRLEGRQGNDQLNGGRGADLLIGGTGNDVYRIDHAGDRITEIAGEGSDQLATSVSYTLANGASVETLGTVNAAATTAVDLTGNDFNNSIYGNAGANALRGAGGSDLLTGLAGNDLLDGGLGNDNLRGGAGQDSFRFSTTLNGATNVDRILDFSVADDTIQLDDAVFPGLAPGPLSPAAFRTGPAASDADDRIIYNSSTGALLFDADGSGGAAAIRFATLDPGLALTANDFTVI